MKKSYLLFFCLYCLANLHATTYYFKTSATDPTVPSNWNTATDGSGTDATVFNFAGDVFIIQTGQKVIQTKIWYFQTVTGYGTYAANTTSTTTGTPIGSTITASYANGATVGEYIYGTGIPAGTTIASIGTSSGNTSGFSISSNIGLSNTTTAALSNESAIYISTASGTSGTNTINFTTMPSSLVVGMNVSGTGVPVSTTITSISGNSVTISNNLTATIATPITFYTAGSSTTSGTLEIQAGATFIQEAPVIALNTFTVDNSGVYKFNFPHGKGLNGDIPGATRTFAASSTIEFDCWSDGTNINGASASGFLIANVTYGNLIINLSSTGYIADAANAANTNFPWGNYLFTQNTLANHYVTVGLFSSSNNSMAGNLTIASLGNAIVGGASGTGISGLTLEATTGYSYTVNGSVSMNSAYGSVILLGNIGEQATITGDLTLNAVGNNNTAALRMVGASTNHANDTVRIGGNFNLTAGNFLGTVSTYNVGDNIQVTGNMTIAGGTHSLITTAGSFTLNVNGNYTQTGGSITYTTNLSSYSALTVGGNYTQNGGSCFLAVASVSVPLSIGGDFILGSGATFNFNQANSTKPYRIRLGGNLNLQAGSTLTSGATTAYPQATFIFGGGTNATPSCTLAGTISNCAPGFISETGKTVTFNNTYTLGGATSAPSGEQNVIATAGGNFQLASGVVITVSQFNEVVVNGGYFDCNANASVIGNAVSAGGGFHTLGTNNITAVLAASSPALNTQTITLASAATGGTVDKGMSVSGQGVPTGTYVAQNASGTSFYVTEPTTAWINCSTSPVTAINVGAGGSGYTSAPAVVVSGGSGGMCTAVATVSGGAVTGITIINNGYGYTSTPTVTLIGGGGTGATATATVGTTSNIGCAVFNGGSNYTVAPALTINGGAVTTTATGTPVVNNGVITGIQMTNVGSYTSVSGLTAIINAGATYTITSSPGKVKSANPLGIGGSIGGNGLTPVFNSATAFEFNGTQAQVTSTSLPATDSVLVINNPAGITLSSNATITNALNINAGSLTTGTNNLVLTAGTGSATLAPGTSLIISGGTTNFNNQLVTLQSNVTGTASIGQIAGTLNNSTNVTLQQYIPGNRAFRLMGHPFVTGISMNQLTSTIDITGGNGAGFTSTATNNPSAYWFKTAAGDGGSFDAGWTAFSDLTQTNGTNAWNKWEGILLFIRGTKGTGLDGNSYTPSVVTLSTNGAINKGIQTIPISNASTGWNLVSNPYPSSVNLTAPLASASLSGAYVWNPTGGSGGAYVAIPASSNYVIPSSSAFFVKSTGTGQSLAFNESDKTMGALATTVFGNQSGLQIDLLQENNFYDRLYVFSDNGAKTAKDNNDMEKLMNPGLSFYSKTSNGTSVSIDSRPIDSSTLIPLFIDTKLSGEYNMSFRNVNFGTTLYLHDKLKGEYELIEDGKGYSFSVILSDSTTMGNRFELTAQKRNTGVAEDSNLSGIKVDIYNANTEWILNYSLEKAAQVSVRLLNVQGMQLKQSELGITTQGKYIISKGQFSEGIYILEMVYGNDRIIKKIIK